MKKKCKKSIFNKRKKNEQAIIIPNDMRHCDLDTVTYRGPIIMIMAQWQPFPGCKQVGPLMRSAENFTVIGVAGSRGRLPFLSPLRLAGTACSCEGGRGSY